VCVGLGRNASGGTSPRLSWGRSVLQHGSPSAVMAPDRHEGAEEMNAEDFGALGLAVGLVGALDERLYTGFPSWIKSRRIPWASAQASRMAGRNSGPLSIRRDAGAS